MEGCWQTGKAGEQTEVAVLLAAGQRSLAVWARYIIYIVNSNPSLYAVNMKNSQNIPVVVGVTLTL